MDHCQIIVIPLALSLSQEKVPKVMSLGQLSGVNPLEEDSLLDGGVVGPRQAKSPNFKRNVSRLKVVDYSFVVPNCVIPPGFTARGIHFWCVSRVELPLPVDGE